MTFNEAKTAQAAALVMSKCGTSLHIVKLMKLLYLADRASLQAQHATITGDRMVSMPHGPVLSTTLNVVSGSSLSKDRPWDRWVNDRSYHHVSLKTPINTRWDLDELSDFDIKIIEGVCARYGHMGEWELRDFTHDAKNCPEWVDPNGSSHPILFTTLFKAFGLEDAVAEELAAEQEDDAALDRMFGAL